MVIMSGRHRKVVVSSAGICSTGESRQLLAPQDGLASNDVFDLEILGDHLWVATARGLASVNRTNLVIENFTPSNSTGMPSRVATALEAKEGGQLWVGFSQEWDLELDNPFSDLRGHFVPVVLLCMTRRPIPG